MTLKRFVLETACSSPLAFGTDFVIRVLPHFAISVLLRQVSGERSFTLFGRYRVRKRRRPSSFKFEPQQALVSIETFLRGSIAEPFSRSGVELFRDRIALPLGESTASWQTTVGVEPERDVFLP